MSVAIAVHVFCRSRWPSVLHLSLFLGLSVTSQALETSSTEPIVLNYPSAQRGSDVDAYHGVRVSDPYRWLEDTNSPKTRAWLKAENVLTVHYLSDLSKRREIAVRIREMYALERWSPPKRFGKYWFYYHNEGVQGRTKLLVTDELLETARVLLDSDHLSTGHTATMNQIGISSDGRLIAYALSHSGALLEQTWHVRDVASGKDLPDEVRGATPGGGSWGKDKSGFYYVSYNEPELPTRARAVVQAMSLRFHKLGTTQTRDATIYSIDSPGWVDGQVTDDGQFLVVTAKGGAATGDILLAQELGVTELKPIVSEAGAQFRFVGNVDRTFYLQTDYRAPFYRIVAVDLDRPEPENWRAVVQERADRLYIASLAGQQLVVQYVHDGHSIVDRYSLAGKFLGEVPLPGIGTAAHFEGHIEDERVYFTYSSYSVPDSVYQLDLTSGTAALWRAPHVSGLTAHDYETTRVTYTGKDNTKIGMFIVSKREARRDGPQPAILEGYGGFDAPITPEFSPAVAAWLQMGGIYAQPNIRGGGEYGRDWHEAGTKKRKQASFDDFISAAEYLIAQGWTRASRLAITGHSNGGLLVAAVEEQRPDLFAAAVPRAAVTDMLRFRESRIGKRFESEYGSVDNQGEFKAMFAYSPYHNVQPNIDYPATLVITGDHDDVVFPAHSFKFVAAMQYANPRGRPILLSVELGTGHEGSHSVAQTIEDTASMTAFILEAFRIRTAWSSPANR